MEASVSTTTSTRAGEPGSGRSNSSSASGAVREMARPIATVRSGSLPSMVAAMTEVA